MSKETIEGFNWEENNHDFFGETLSTENNPADIVDEVVNDEIEIPGQETSKPAKNKPAKTEDEVEQELIDTQFKSFDENYVEDKVIEEVDEDDPNKGKQTVTKIGGKQALEFLKDKGFIDVELEEGKELTDEEADELVEEKWETSIQEGIEETIKELPDTVKNLIRVATNGGDVNQFLAKLATMAKVGITKDTDMSVEANQVKVLTEDLRDQGYDDDYIETNIQFLKDNGKLQSFSEKIRDKKVAKQEAEAAAEAQRVAKTKEDNKAKAKAYKIGLVEKAKEVKDIKGLPLTKADKEKLPSYIADATVELEDGRRITPMQSALFKAMADPEKILLLAKLLDNDFDFSSIANTATTKQAREARTNIQNTDKINTDRSTGSSQKPKKSLAEMMD